MSMPAATCSGCLKEFLWDEEALGCSLCGWGGGHDPDEPTCDGCIAKHEDKLYCSVIESEEAGHYFEIMARVLLEDGTAGEALKAVRREWMARKV